MSKHNIVWKDREGRSAPAIGVVTHYNAGARVLRGGAVAVGGTVLGLATIVVPVAHLISTWLIPLLSWFIGYYIYSIETVLGPSKGDCPGCGEHVELEGGVLASDTWMRCPKCQLPMRFEVEVSE